MFNDVVGQQSQTGESAETIKSNTVSSAVARNIIDAAPAILYHESMAESIDLGTLTEDAWVWIGHSIPEELLEGLDVPRDRTPMYAGVDSIVTFSNILEPIIEFMKSPRTTTTLKAWFHDSGLGEDTLVAMLSSDNVAHIEAGERALPSLTGFKLEHFGCLLPKNTFAFDNEPDNEDENEMDEPGSNQIDVDSVVYGNIMRSDNPESPNMELSDIMRYFLFSNDDENRIKDIPEMVIDTANHLQVSTVAVVSELYRMAPILMDNDMAYLIYNKPATLK